jgi:hypothetical protein
MTTDEIALLVAEYERKWRLYTPARSPSRVLPASRVPWTEVYTFGADMMGRKWSIDDRIKLEPHITKLLKRLRREFPNERWKG